MGHQKKPWDDVPVEVLIEYERKKKEQRKDHREQLRAPMLRIPEYIEAEEQEDEHAIIIKL
tara:strand:+ start:2012 stop:2194 length:183 start_codon:yes stop_codon:yes gene_type:complete